MRRKILFIINPVSGSGKQKQLKDKIPRFLNTGFQPEIRFTERPGHAGAIARDAIGVYDVVIAVGGDGTVHEVGCSLIGTETVLGIIPTGSGNGLARYLKIPMDMERALEAINHSTPRAIDSVRVNDAAFINVAGIGFDALIGHLFADHGQRGFLSYVQLALWEFLRFVPKRYRVIVDGVEYVEKAFLISFANASQWGNNAYIAPKAKIDDGFVDVCFLKEFPVSQCPLIASRIFAKTIDSSRYMTIIRGKRINVVSDEPLKAHLDGEPVIFSGRIIMDVLPLSLWVLVAP